MGLVRDIGVTYAPLYQVTQGAIAYEDEGRRALLFGPLRDLKPGSGFFYCHKKTGVVF